MIHPSKVVSIHPYFKVKPGKMAEAKALLAQFIAKVTTEPNNLYYDFTIKEDVIFCREAYAKAEGLLAHAEGVGQLLSQMLNIAELLRVEVHASAEEIQKLKGPLAGLNPEWFVFETGVVR